MSLSQDPLVGYLKNRYICGYRDITGEPWAGKSGIHPADGQAFYAKNGAGPHNLQLFVLAPDGTVLHALPGYWDPHDLFEELRFAESMGRLWARTDLSPDRKRQLYSQFQLGHVREHSAATVARSQMENFDKKYELKVRPHTSDTIVSLGDKPVFKTTDVIMHERMAARPFVSYRDFDVAAFSDYGKPRYDKKEDSRDPNRVTKKRKKQLTRAW